MSTSIASLIASLIAALLAASHACAATLPDKIRLKNLSFSGSGTRLIGRFDRTVAGAARFTWPGSALEFRFDGTAAALGIADSGNNRFLVEVDGVSHMLLPTSGAFQYALATGLSKGIHAIRVTRITESFEGESAFVSDPVVDGQILPAPAAPQRRLLVLGDSITAGYGVEGAGQTCPYSPKTSNQQLTYTAMTANLLKADLHTIAWSGIGAWRAYGETTPTAPTIGQRYSRILADDPQSSWNPANYQPDAVLIAIGTNDYWYGQPDKSYRKAMDNLLGRLAEEYPASAIYLIVSPMLQGRQREAHRTVLESLTSVRIRLIDLGKMEKVDGFGCDGHPTPATQARLAKALVRELTRDFAW
ncbi:MAG: SGNH/GDSL hydrolase family protein [Pseudomonadota bacterium]